LVVKRGEETPRFLVGKNMPRFENFSVEKHLESQEPLWERWFLQREIEVG